MSSEFLADGELEIGISVGEEEETLHEGQAGGVQIGRARGEIDFISFSMRGALLAADAEDSERAAGELEGGGGDGGGDDRAGGADGAGDDGRLGNLSIFYCEADRDGDGTIGGLEGEDDGVEGGGQFQEFGDRAVGAVGNLKVGEDEFAIGVDGIGAVGAEIYVRVENPAAKLSAEFGGDALKGREFEPVEGELDIAVGLGIEGEPPGGEGLGEEGSLFDGAQSWGFSANRWGLFRRRGERRIG